MQRFSFGRLIAAPTADGDVLPSNIPVFLKEVGYKFETVVKDDVMTLVF